MKILFEKDTLISAVTPALSAVSDRSTISAIEGILFTTVGSTSCDITTYDLEKGFRTTLEAQVFKPGSYIINANKLYRIIKMMPDKQIMFEVDDKNVVKITSGRSEFKLSVLPGEDFPNLPELNGDRGYTVSQGVLKKTIAEISHAIAQNDQRPVLNGAYFNIANNKLKVVSCDGNRLAIRERECEITDTKKSGEGQNPLGISFIVPGKTLSELMKLLSDSEENVMLIFGRKHIIFAFQDTVFFSRMIDGDFIDYEKVIPKSNKIVVSADREELIDCLERASLVTDDRSMGQVRSYVRCAFEGGVLKISSVSAMSSVYEEIETEKTGDDIIIGFNCRYLLDALRAATGDMIDIYLSTPLMSIIIKENEKSKSERLKDETDKKDDGDYLYMVCPVKMKE